MQPRDLSSELRKLLAGGASLDTALSQLRANGASIVECIISVRSFRGGDLAEAKRMVELSAAWADVRALNDQIHAELEAAAGEWQSDA